MQDYFAGMEPESDEVPQILFSLLSGAGGTDEDARLLRVVGKDARAAVFRFLVHYRRGGGVKIVPQLETLQRHNVDRGWPRRQGGISLVGHARNCFEGFELSNELSTFYVVTLRILYPEFSASLEFSDSTAASLLLWHGWNPCAK